MKSLAIATAFCFVLSSTASAADEVKEIKLEGLKAERPMTRPTMPTEIKTAEDLAKAFPQEEFAAAVKKQVDFEKQKLVFFAWAGSGQDKISGDVVKEEVVFTYTPGRTRDLRSHFHLFAVQKDAKVKVETGKIGR